MSTTITIELPDDIANVLRKRWVMICPSVPLRRSPWISHAHFVWSTRSRDVGVETRMEVDAFLKRHGTYLNTEAEFEKDMATLEQRRNIKLITWTMINHLH